VLDKVAEPERELHINPSSDQMKNGIQFIAAMSLAVAGLIGTTATVNHVVATTLTQCDCGNVGCQGGCRARKKCERCNTDCGCTQCPQCDGEICKLELDNSKVKKTCFKVEQEAICVPSVRLPWKNCAPCTSKTRTVNRLKTHSYECPNCAYQWKLSEPCVEADVAPTSVAPTSAAVEVTPTHPANSWRHSPKQWTPFVPPTVEGQVLPPGQP
jgi:hypothetical protein